MAHSGVCCVSHDLPENPPESDGGRAGSLTDGCRRGVRTVGRRLERRTQMTDAATSEQPAPDGGDSSIRPQDDLFGYVNGSWYAAAEIPPDLPMTGAAVQLLLDAEAQVGDILRASAARAASGSAPAGSPEQQIGDLYTS